jgi:poly [ADP-ribose] polymerase
MLLPVIAILLHVQVPVFSFNWCLLIVESDDGKSYMVYWRYGRVGHRGRFELIGPKPRHEAISLFTFKFWHKTNNEWSDRNNFRCYSNKYTWLEMDYGKERVRFDLSFC